MVCKAVRRGVKRAVLSCDFPFGPLQQGTDSAVSAAILLVKEAGADMIKLDGAADFPEAVSAITRAGIPGRSVWDHAPDCSTLRHSIQRRVEISAQVPAEMTAMLVRQAKCLEDAEAVCWTSPTPGRWRAPRLCPRF